MRNRFKAGSSWVIIFLLVSLIGCNKDEVIPVDANFSADKTSISPGESITFSDVSTGNPTTWQWTFEGGMPETSSEQNPEVSYALPGQYTVTLNAAKEGVTDTETKAKYVSVTCNECSPVCPDLCKPGFRSGLSIKVDDTARSYDILLPTGYSNSADFPVIIDLHGSSSTKADQRSFSGFSGIANANGIIMVWPQALELTTCLSKTYRWNANLTNAPDDIGFISALIDKLIANYQVDETRIYVTGMSNGGFMTYSLACALSNKIAAIASVAGSMTDNLLNNVCQPARAVPVLEIHGTADQICNYEGYTNCEGHQAAVEDVIAFWRTRANCSASFDEVAYDNINTDDGCTARILTFQGCSTSNMIKLVIIDGGGHTWPGSAAFYNYYKPYESVLFPMNFDINASEIIWDFFSQHQLTN